MSFFLPEDYITILDQLLSRVLQKQQYLLVWTPRIHNSVLGALVGKDLKDEQILYMETFSSIKHQNKDFATLHIKAG